MEPTELEAIRDELYRDIESLKARLELMQDHCDQISALIFRNCEHKMVIDDTNYYPCGWRPFICKLCGYRTG